MAVKIRISTKIFALAVFPLAGEAARERLPLRDRYEEAWVQYRARRFHSARGALRGALEPDPEDTVAGAARPGRALGAEPAARGLGQRMGADGKINSVAEQATAVAL